MAEDENQAVLLLGLLELLLQPAELHVGHRSIGACNLIAGIEPEGANEGSEVGLPPGLAGRKVVLGEAVTHRTRGPLGSEMFGHELGLREQVTIGVGRHGVEARAAHRHTARRSGSAQQAGR